MNCQVIQLDGLGDSSSEDDNQEDDDDDDENDEANDDTPAEEEVRFVLVFFTNGDSSRVHCQNVDNENVDSHNVEMSKYRQWKWRKSEWRTLCAICCDRRNTCKEKKKKSCHTYMCISTS